MLVGTNAKQFYPTPNELVQKMYKKVNWIHVESILEPSAGKGNLVEEMQEYNNDKYYLSHPIFGRGKFDIDCIEIDTELQSVLSSKGLKVVFNDFLNYEHYKSYDLIIMNPPFENGDEHLLKAIHMQEINGGQVVCLLNAETIKNPYTHRRKELLELLEKHNADVEYIENGFSHSERKTDVEIALIYLNIPRTQEDKCDIYENLKRAEELKQDEFESKEMTCGGFIDNLVSQFNLEVKSVIELNRQYQSLKQYMLNNQSGVQLVTGTYSNNYQPFHINRYLKDVRKKYWKYLFNKDEFVGRLTTNLKDKYMDMIDDMANYDFNEFNIQQIIVRMNSELKQGLDETLDSLFEKLTSQHTWFSECSKNIHYYNGWKTNKAHKINNKVIIPVSVYDYFWKRLEINKGLDLLSDIEKGFNYLNSKGLEYPVDLRKILEVADKNGQTKNIPCNYFDVTFFKKGTMHIKFTNQEVVDALNIWAGRRKGWLPPSYGTKHYSEMNREEREVIDDFQGKEKYEQVMSSPNMYLISSNSMLGLPSTI